MSRQRALVGCRSSSRRQCPARVHQRRASATRSAIPTDLADRTLGGLLNSNGHQPIQHDPRFPGISCQPICKRLFKKDSFLPRLIIP